MAQSAVLSSAHKGRLEMRRISMEFPGVKALNGVNFEAHPGELLALMGENGAGKSTLMKILSGVIPYPRFQGQIFLDGEEKQFSSTLAARASGIAIIHQELNSFPDLTVAENLFLTMEPLQMKLLGVINERARDKKAREILEEIGVDMDVRRPLGDFNVGAQQLVEIARALLVDAQVLVLDEPTSALTVTESEKLFSIIEDLKKRGKTLIYISHRMEEVFRLADRIEVLRDGTSVGGGTKAEMTPDRVISLMVGRNIEDLYPHRSPRFGKEVLRVEKFCIESASSNDPAVKDVSFSVREGEILGIAGLVGAGRTELVSGIFGAYPAKRLQGKLFLDGKEIRNASPSEAIKNGLGLVTEDRKMSGLLLGRSVEENLTLAALSKVSRFGILNPILHHKMVEQYVSKLRIKTAHPRVEVRTLSGGNQQKIVLAKWLATEPRVLFLDEPTRGIDVGARQEIYNLIDMLASHGVAIVMVSSDLPEVLGLSDRVLVMREGRVAGVLEGKKADQKAVMELAAGV